jgi:hypothetical protein
MIQRKVLNELVVLTLGRCDEPVRACELYEMIKHDNVDILRIEKVRGFRSFAKIVSSFSNVSVSGEPFRFYRLKNGFIK